MAAILSVAPVHQLDATVKQAIIAICTDAFDEDFQALFELLPATTHVMAHEAGQLVGHACWVTRWLHQSHLPPIRTAYIEAVAVAPAHKRQGIGTAIMQRVAQEVVDFPLAALSPATFEFYRRLGWELWRGPLAIRTADGLKATPEEQIMLLRTPTTPPLDPAALMTAEWRPGELW
jgi:aminoglycoside 2'-N-acetyltransferase I